MPTHSHAPNQFATQRDNQKGRVIRSSLSLRPISRKFDNIWDRDSYTRTILNDPWFRSRYGELSLKVKSNEQSQILFLLCKRKHAKHNVLFCKDYLDLVERYMGGMARKILEESFLKNKIVLH